MYFGKHRVQHWAAYLTLGIIAAVLLVVITALGTSFQSTPQPSATAGQNRPEPALVSGKHGATDYLIGKLKSYGLWKIYPPQEVPRLLIESYPADLQAVEDISIRKRVFLHSLLPHALVVRQEALQKRDRLESILNRIDCSLEEINFDAGLEYETGCSWSDFLAEDDIRFIEKLCTNYRTTTAEGLLERVDAVPTSIILAQGALESSWGSSRFTREGNSIFGMWTWRNKGMVPSRREEGKTHKVTSYGSILDSVRAYHLTLNRLNPYDRFRELRRQTNDPLVLADGLILYSERGEEYVEDIKKVILSNDLQKYDNCRLSDIDLPEFSGPVNKKPAPAASGKASL